MHTAKTLLLGVLMLVAGCATTPTIHGPRVSQYPLPAPPRAMVLVLDGAGGTEITGKTLETVVHDQGLPLAVVPYTWTHGWGRFLADQGDADHLDSQAEAFARYVLATRAENPGLPINVLTFSAGSGVVTRAARLVPPDTFERVVMLAPAIASNTDIRPLLVASRRGVDAFTSNRDVFLALGTAVYGTTGGARGSAAGFCGFEPVVSSQADVLLYRTKLRQYAWTPDLLSTGHTGLHNGPHQPCFMLQFVVPKFLGGS
jgi:hypothetical protein